MISFADSKLKPTLKQIKKEALQSGFFDEVHTYNERTFESGYWKKYRKWYESNPRGFGYWCWKPYIIQRELLQMQEGDILVYLDAGCILNPKAKKRFEEYVEMAKANGIVCFDHTRCFVKQYTKSDVLHYFKKNDDEAVLESRQLMSGILIMQNNEKTKSFISQWFNIMHENPSLIDDSPSKHEEHPDFRENRHDQSIFSLLAKDYGVTVLSQGEVYPTPCDWSTMDDYPFWAARRKIFSKPSLARRIIIKVETVFNKMHK